MALIGLPLEIHAKQIVPHLNLWETGSFGLVSKAAYDIIHCAAQELQRDKTFENKERFIRITWGTPAVDIRNLGLQKLKMQILDSKPELIDKLASAKKQLTDPNNQEYVQSTLKQSFPDATSMKTLFEYHVKKDSMGQDTDTWLSIVIFDFGTTIAPIQPEHLEPALKFAVHKKNHYLVRAILHTWNAQFIPSDTIHAYVNNLIGSDDLVFKKEIFPFLLHRSLFRRIDSIAYDRIGQLLFTSVQKNDTDCARMILSHAYAAKIPAKSNWDIGLDKILEEAKMQENQEVIDLIRAHPNFKGLEEEKTLN